MGIELFYVNFNLGVDYFMKENLCGSRFSPSILAVGSSSVYIRSQYGTGSFAGTSYTKYPADMDCYLTLKVRSHII